MAKFEHPYLNLARMEMLRKVRLRPHGLAEGTFSGPHKSNYRGTAVEFSDYRDYVEGYDIRMVDWRVYARTDKHYVRLYEAERNLLTYLVVDTSESMAFSGAAKITDAKLVYACRMAAALAYIVVSEGDQVSLSLADEKVRGHLPARSSWSHLGAVLETLEHARAAERTDLGACMMEVYRRISRRGVLIVLSDFLDNPPEFWRAIDLFRRSKFDIMLFHVVHPEEQALPEVPQARFLEMEGGSGVLNAEPAEIADLYRQRFAAFLAGVQANARTRGCDWFLARTDQDPYLFLKQCFLARQV